MSKEIDYNTLEVDGIDTRDYPDFCDAFISYGEYKDGTELSENDMDTLTENGTAYELIFENQLWS